MRFFRSVKFKRRNNHDKKENLSFDSKVVHGALGSDPISGAVSFPIFQSATFRHRDFGVSTGYDYSRLQKPTRQELERTMAILEEGVESLDGLVHGRAVRRRDGRRHRGKGEYIAL